VTESGFDKIPVHRREAAILRNDSGWAQQLNNIEAHLAKN
jgi:hypothetical protein